MLVRSLVMVLSLVGFIAAFALQLLVPSLAQPVFFGLLIWIAVSLFIYRLPVMGRTIGGAPSSSTYLDPPGPLPSSAPVELDFCHHCGTTITPGTMLCPSCGRSIGPV